MKAEKVFFIGIGGIGMSALAQLYAHEGKQVTGSDREASPVTELLERKGIKVIIGQKSENVPADVTVVVYSDSVPQNNPERTEALQRGIPQFSYFAMLGKVSEGKKRKKKKSPSPLLDRRERQRPPACWRRY